MDRNIYLSPSPIPTSFLFGRYSSILYIPDIHSDPYFIVFPIYKNCKYCSKHCSIFPSYWIFYLVEKLHVDLAKIHAISGHAEKNSEKQTWPLFWEGTESSTSLMLEILQKEKGQVWETASLYIMKRSRISFKKHPS